MIYIGIDPGKDGALAAILCGGDGRILDVCTEFFDEAQYQTRLAAFSEAESGCKCCLEHVWGIQGQAAGASFRFGENFGFIHGLLTAYSIPYELVTPQKWKREFQVTGDKNSAIAVCRRLFPTVNLRKTERSRKDHDGLAEALLMAEYARRRL